MAHAIASHEHHDSTDIFGFWIYILSDCILFASIFAVYAVLHNNLFGGPGMKQFVNTHYVFGETMALLTSSFTFGLAVISQYRNQFKSMISWLIITFLLGSIFITMEINEFIHLYLDGFRWQNSAALSAFYTLVGTHGLHVFIGLIWIIISIIQLFSFGLTPVTKKRLVYLGLFWAFLDIVWIFVFTIVYLMGVI